MALYLLHFDRPFKHAKHYLGFARDMDRLHQRVDMHYAATYGDGQHHKLMQAVRAAGISFTLARIWPEGSRIDEKRKKQSGHARRCPICKEQRAQSV